MGVLGEVVAIGRGFEIYCFYGLICRRREDCLVYFILFRRMYFPILINWMSPFPILGLLGGIFHFYSNFKRKFCGEPDRTPRFKRGV